MGSIIEMIQSVDLGKVFYQVINGKGTGISITPAVAIALLAAAVILCFLGIKLVRVCAALAGLGSGFLLGLSVGELFLAPSQAMIAGLVLGVVLGGLLAWWYRGGVFVVVFLLTVNLLNLILHPHTPVVWICCAAAGILAAVLAEFFTAPVIILLTALHGGMMAGLALGTFESFSGSYLIYVIGVLLTAIGIVVQFLLEFRHKTRQGVAKADQIREKESTANEVARARGIVDGLDDLDDNGDVEYLDDPDDLDLEDLKDLGRLDEPDTLEELDEAEIGDMEEIEDETEDLPDEEEETGEDYEEDEPEYLDDEEDDDELEYLDDDEILYLDDDEEDE